MNELMTRSPTFTEVTSGPTASTVPAPSWPRMAGTGHGNVPSTMDRSEWHTPEAPMRRTTSRGPGGTGVTSSTEMGALTPTKRAAFMSGFLCRSGGFDDAVAAGDVLQHGHGVPHGRELGGVVAPLLGVDDEAGEGVGQQPAEGAGQPEPA